MSDELLAEILARPDDDAPRLVYADWLEEHAELDRATMIREQCTLARVPKYDARWPAHWTWARAHQHAAPLAELPPGLRWHPFAYRRGFAERMYVEDPDALHRLAPTTPISVLDVDARAEKFALDRLLAWPGLAHVTRVEFSLGGFGAKHIAMLDDAPNLAHVDTLVFEFDGLRDVAALLRARVVQQLARLDIHSNAFAASAFRDVPALPRLRRLALTQDQMSPAHAQAIAGDALPNLARLDISGNPQLGVGGWRAIATAPWRLEHLGIASTYPRLDGVRALVASPHVRTLRALYIGGNRLGPKAAKLLASTTWPALEQLDTSANPDLGELARAPFPKLAP